MKHYVSRRSFMKAAGVSAAAMAMAASFGTQRADACLPFLKKSPVTILYTNDAHTYIDKESPELSYASIAALKQSYVSAGQDVLLVDAGDHVQGTAYGSMDEGASIIQLMNAAGYDLATLGNHEFDYGMEGCMQAVEWADYPYLSCNFYHEKDGVAGDNVLDSYKVFEVGGVKIAFVGITTPESFTKSTPSYFQDENGNYIYGIAGGTDGEALYTAVQNAIDAASAEADYVIALGHLGVDESSQPWTSREVIAHTVGFDAFIDGHSHTEIPYEEVKDAAGNTVVLTQTGNYLDNVGRMTLGTDGTITTELISSYEGRDGNVDAIQAAWINSVDDMLGEKIAYSDINFYISDPNSGKRLIRSEETNMGDFVADGIYSYFNEIEELNCDIAIMNGGGIRADEYAGYWSFKTCKEVSPFGNVACLMEVTGQQIQDALEFGARYAGSGQENGGFLQVAGASYEIHTSLPNTVQTDDKGVWTGSATGTPRVQNVKIYNKQTGTYEPLDPNRTYAMAGMNYTLRNLGDGFAMFDGAKLIKDYVSEDYLVMASYAMMFGGVDAEGLGHLNTNNSPLADYPGYLIHYENPRGAGRIVLR